MNRRGFIKMLGVTPAIGLLPKIKSKKRKEVYFSDKGDDIKGDGSWDKPYKTIGRAFKDNTENIYYKMEMAVWGRHKVGGSLKNWQLGHSEVLYPR